MNRRIRYSFAGVVQGVGFRPFIYRLAVKHHLRGWVKNRPEGVILEGEGDAEALASFYAEATNNFPPLADVTSIVQEDIPLAEDVTFRIIASDRNGKGDVHITPDTATCPDCLKELFAPEDRRYRYPFINCTNCGPRLTIIRDIPYDRSQTSMACFPLCTQCRHEYENAADRRFHAEPNACPVCGPTLSLFDGDGNPVDCDEPLLKAIECLQSGAIMAIKGLGGFHLCCDAANDEAVSRLRSRKYREEKPLAVMVRDMTMAERLAHIGKEEGDLLLAPERPIVLLRKKESKDISPLIAPGMTNLGIMLPYTPLQHLLIDEPFIALVMTSANQTDEPICIGNREAIVRLSGIADGYLVHDRDILVRCDDSIAAVCGGKKMISRRSRGYAPKPIAIHDAYPPVMALGPQMKSTICILKGSYAFLSPHIGDMETPQARDFFHETITLMERITESRPKTVACDLHPAYYSTMVAEKLTDVEVIKVQHHHAHIVSCMAEQGLSGQVIGIAMDGTGYGSDGNIWGGEFLLADVASFKRVGHLAEFFLPGGEKAIREPWRIAASLLRQAYGDQWLAVAEQFAIGPDRKTREKVDHMMTKGLNVIPTSSVGRLFDGVAALIGLRSHVSFEGQAAMELEAIANREVNVVLPLPVVAVDGGDALILNTKELIRGIVAGLTSGQSRQALSSAFHGALAAACAETAILIRQNTGDQRVVLSGGCFQNRLLLESCVKAIKKADFEVFFHQRTPTNDGGISLGQAVCAGAILKNRGKRYET